MILQSACLKFRQGYQFKIPENKTRLTGVTLPLK